MSSPDGLAQLSAFLQEEGLKPEAVLLTHGHFDHVWGVDRLLAEYPVPVYMHPADKDIMSQVAQSFRNIDGSSPLVRHKFTTVDIQDGDQLNLAGMQWKVLHTPGHTPGSVCYWSEADNLLLSGDTLFAGSIGRTDLAGGDYDALMDSIRTKLLSLPGETDVIPGHGQPTSIAREGMYNPFLQPFNDPDTDWWNQEGISIKG